MAIVVIMGNVGSDPETRFAPSGQKIVSFSIAENTKKQGKEVTTWWRITIFGDRFDKMLSYVKKGSYLVVYGEMSLDTWTKDGREHTQLSVIADNIKFGPSSRNNQDGQQGYGQGAPQAQSYGASHQQPSYGSPSYGAPQQPAFAPAQPQPFAPAPAPIHDFSFGEASGDHGAHGDEETPF